jgi:hypothetical protein
MPESGLVCTSVDRRQRLWVTVRWHRAADHRDVLG